MSDADTPNYAHDPVAERLLAEHGRRLASEREDLIAQGVNPADLAVPLHPGAGTPTPDLEARIEAGAKALHEHVEAGFVNKGKRLKWENDLVDRDSYRGDARVVLAAAGVPALITEVERLRDEVARRQRAETFHFDRANRVSAELTQLKDAMVDLQSLPSTAELLRLRVQRQAALDRIGPRKDRFVIHSLRDLGAAYVAADVDELFDAVRAALGATE